MRMYTQNLRNGTFWAQYMWDASGRYSSQFLWGNSYRLGSYTQCTETEAPFPAAFSVASVAFHQPGAEARQLRLGLCLPAACSDNASALLSAALVPSASLQRVRPVPDPRFSFWTLPAFYCLCVAVSAMGLLVATGTVVDLLLQRRRRARSREPEVIECNGNHLSYTASGPPEDKEPPVKKEVNSRQGTWLRLLLCFSLRTNIGKLLDVGSGSDALSCVHGLRVFSLLWVIAGHTCMFAFPFADNRGFRKLVERDFLFQSISSGAFSVDTFFFMSGLLLAFMYFKMDKKQEVSEVPVCTKFKSSFLRFIGIFSYRFLRLTPPYLLVLCLAYLVTIWFAHNSVMDPPTQDHLNCPKYWWRNLLYINTLFPVNNMCMIWSWYLANDTQFYALGMILLLVSSVYFKTAVVTMFTLLVCSWITTAVITLNTNHTPSIDQPLGLFDELYDKPWTRLGPYVVGMCVGYLLNRTNCKIRIPKVAVAAGWALSMAVTFWLVHGLYGELSAGASAAYVALGHSAWALALAWVAIACCTGHGGVVNTVLSQRMLVPLSRLTYCAYLLHPVIMLSAIMHIDAPLHLSRDTMIMVIFGYFTCSYLLSFVVSMTFEAPVIAVLNVVHPLKKNIKK
ncbi:nose resistant to fluoxetine protein 6-like [Schistocerca americana]|uniref:nose resistant to fluoxetine protein 6-like n=1 Tax=Schistocerca americana TaxID=7009 RepID=UPI001F4F7D0D|nr:nose resistant to fluoxetine protein 6-like [Schistocerca americana]